MKKAVVMKSTGSWYELRSIEDGKKILARNKGKLRLQGKTTTNPIAVGDNVLFSLEHGQESALIEELIPRKNYLIRKSNNLSRQEQIIAANIDQVLLLATLAFPRTSLGFIDRILCTTEAYEIPAILVFNKIDLLSDQERENLHEVFELYKALGYKCIAVSLKTGENLEELKSLLKGKISLVTGHSGVGKSTLINYFIPENPIKTGNISAYSSKGKHTTTFAEMHPIDGNTYIIDTPGIKDFGLVDMDKEELSHYFPEMRNFLGHCKFNNCLHVNEPGCAVLVALEKEEIAPSRYYNYLSMLENDDSHR